MDVDVIGGFINLVIKNLFYKWMLIVIVGLGYNWISEKV